MAELDLKILEQDIKRNIAELKKMSDVIDEVAKKSLENIGTEKGTKQVAELTKKVQELEQALHEKNNISEREKLLEEELFKLQNDKIKQSKKIKDLTDEELKIRIVEQKTARERMQQLKAELALRTKEVKSLRDVREQISALKFARDSLDYNEDAEAVKNYNDAIDLLSETLENNVDKQSKAKLNVGNYTESIKEAIGSNLGFGASFQQFSEIAKVGGETLKETAKQSVELAKGLVTAEGGTKKVSNGLKLIGTVGKASGILAIVTILASITTFFTSFSEGTESLRVFKAEATAVFDVVINKLGNAFNGFSNIASGLFGVLATGLDFIKGDFSQGMDNFNTQMGKVTNGAKQVSNSFEGTTDSIKKQVEQARLLEEKLIALEKANVGLQRSVFKLKLEEDDLRRTVDDATLGLATREKALKKLEETERKRLGLDKTIAITAFENEKEKLALTGEVTKQTIQNLFNTNETSKRFGIEELKRLQELFEAKENAIDNLEDLGIESAERDREIRLKFILNDIDSIKRVSEMNEKVIQKQFDNEETTYEQRLKLIKDFSNNSIDASKKQQLQIEKTLDTEQKKNRLRILNQEKIDLLATSSNTNLVNSEIKKLDLSDKAEDALRILLDLRREELAQIQELSKESEEIERKRLDGILKRNTKASESIADLQREEIIQDLEKYNELEKNRDLYNKGLDLIKKNKLEDLEKEKEIELNLKDLTEKEKLLIEEQYRIKSDSIIDSIESKRKSKEEELKKQQLESEKELQQAKIKLVEAGADKIIASTKKASDKRIELLEKENQESEKQQDFLQDLAGKGDVNASKSLALEKENVRKRTQEIEKEKQKQIRTEIVLQGLKVFANNVAQPNAMPKTLTEMLTLITSLSSIQGFYTGTNTTVGDVLGYNSKRDAHLVRVDSKEAILNPTQTSDLGIGRGRTTSDVVDIVKMHDLNLTGSKSNIQVVKQGDVLVANEIKSLKKEITNLKTSFNFSIDDLNDAMEIKIRNGNKIKTNRAFL